MYPANHKIKSLESVFPVWKIENDCLIDKLGNVTVGFQLSLPEIFTMSSDDYKNEHSSWYHAIKTCAPGTIIHKQDWFLQASNQADFEKENDKDPSFLGRASERHFNERPWIAHESYLYLTFVAAGKFTANALSTSLIRSSMVPVTSIDPKAIADFIDRVGQFVKILTDDGMLGARRLTDEELSSTPTKAGLLERYCHLQAAEEPKMNSDILLEDDLKVGDKNIKLFTLSDTNTLPEVCGPRITFDKYSSDTTKFSIGFATPLGLLLDCNHIYNQYILVEDPAVSIRKQEKRRLQFQSLSTYSRGNSSSRDAVNQYLTEALVRKIVKAHFNLVCFTDNKNEIREIKNKVASGMSQLDARVKIETDSAAQLFWAGIPGNAAGLPVAECFDTFAEQACCFLNAETNYSDSVSTVGMRLGDRLTGKPVTVDLSEEPMRKGIITNRNKFLFAPTGGGKSVFCNHMIRSAVEQGAHAVLVDVGHSYSGLCELLNGKYFTYSETRHICFNPFYVEGVLDTEKKENIKALLLSLWKKDDESFTRSEYITLSNAVQGYFQLPDGFRSFNGFYEYVSESFYQQFKSEKINARDFDIDNFLYVLRPYYRGGEYDFLLNATDNLDLLHEPLVVFELDNIKDHPILLPVVTLIIMELFISKMRKLKGVRKIILIEEAWKAIARNGMAEYIKYLFKTVRKFYGEAIIVTQDIEDIINNEIVKNAIIHSSDCKILLDQSKYLYNFDRLQKLLGLTEKEKILILSMEKSKDYKMIFISLGGTHAKVYRVELSLEELLAYTTEEKEKIQVQAYAKRYGSMRKGIKVLANELRDKQQQ